MKENHPAWRWSISPGCYGVPRITTGPSFDMTDPWSALGFSSGVPGAALILNSRCIDQKRKAAELLFSIRQSEHV